MRAPAVAALLVVGLALDAASAFHVHHTQLPAAAAVSSSRRGQQLQMRQEQRLLPRVPLAALTVLAANMLAPLLPAVALPQTAPEVNPQKLLIDALPNPKNPALVDMASSLAKITTEGSGNIRSIDAKGFKGIKPWPEVLKAQRSAAGLLGGRSKDLLVGVKPGNEQVAQAALESLKQSVDELGAAAEGQDRFAAVNAQVKALKALDRLGTLEVRGSVRGCCCDGIWCVVGAG